MKTFLSWLFRLLFIAWCLTNLYRYFFVSHETRHLVRGIIFGLFVVAEAGLLIWKRRSIEHDNSDDDEGDKQELISIVMLSSQSFDFSKDQVGKAMERAWGIIVDRSQNATENFVVGDERMFMIASKQGMLTLHEHEGPYGDDPVDSESIPDLRLRKLVSEHRAWAALDLLKTTAEGHPRDAYPSMAQIVAELIDGHCLALYMPETNRLVALDDEVIRLLRSDRPMDAFEKMIHPPIIGVDGDDPRIKAAVAEAQQRLPEFFAAFESDMGEGYSVKAEFRQGENSEFFWVEVTAIEGGVVYGRLGNEPSSLADLHLGDPVKVLATQVNDWLYLQNDKMVGGFSVKVLGEIEGQ